MYRAEQWLIFPLLDSCRKLQYLKHTGFGKGEHSSMEPNIELRNKLKYKQKFGSRRVAFQISGGKINYSVSGNGPLTSHLEKPYQTPDPQNKLIWIK